MTSPTHDLAQAAVRSALLAWYDRVRRDLPWRRTRDPYAIWVSEMMLQQTQVATVLDYYARWMQTFPDVQTLAAASEDAVLAAWQGLGYYSRARNLLRGARAVVTDHGGQVPRTLESLRKLPGIGPYSAGAIASIAYGLRTPLVDGNVVRVLCRLAALRGDPSRAPLRRQLWDLAGKLVPERRAGDFNQALMELGATVCTPKAPRCDTCPVRGQCLAAAQGSPERLPELPARPQATKLHMVAAVAVRRGRALVVRTPETAARWAGMWQFPAAELEPRELPEAAVRRVLHAAVGLHATPKGLITVVKHGVTRYRITLDAYRVEPAGGAARASAGSAVAWRTADELRDLAMPAAHRRIASQLAELLR